MATPKLALIPTGYKAGKLYSVLPESGVGDFTVVRATEATRVNEAGLIETMGANVPRLDYSGGGCPVLLTEGQSTNLISYSEDFSDSSWTKSGSSVTSGFTSPDGTTNAFKLVEDTSTGRHETQAANSSSGDLAFSFFAKKGENSFIQITNGQNPSAYANFDLNLGVVGSSNVYTPTIIDYGNGWYRCIATINAASSINYARIGLITSSTSARVESYTGDGTSGVYIYGAQLEANASYSTSYIKTEGSAVTRNADQVFGAGDASTFNDSEGVLMAEISALNDTVSAYNSIGLGSSLVTDRIGLGFQPNDTIYAYKRGGSSAYWLPFKTVDITSLNKVALSYNTNDNHFWVNGFKIASNTTIGDVSNITELEFEASYGLEEFYGNTSQVQYFNTALTDSELETLTSWASFIEMAQALNYNII